ncbi:hypothetical protein GLYMA_20G194150v4 [Glycine max]|nr:hypothetical protein GLYMA_20G194150v4 [Glycine max]KAH1036947.1 hypothetical protein GYH30_056388 [Glycine max]
MNELFGENSLQNTVKTNLAMVLSLTVGKKSLFKQELKSTCSYLPGLKESTETINF